MLARDLPFDILGEIFIQCLPDTPSEERRASVKIAPMLLCQICSTWRKAAIGHPQLWAHLCLRYTFTVNRVINCWKGGPREASDEQYVDTKTLAFVAWWMGNASTIPISLYIHNFRIRNVTCYLDERGYYISGFWPDEDVQPLPQFLSTTFHSVVHLELALGRDELHDLCVKLAPTAFRSLKSLTLHTYIGYRLPGRYMFPPTPRLRHLHLTGYRDLPSFRWIQLTRLCISGMIKEEDWLYLLENCRNLVSAAFHIDTIGRDSLEPPSSPHFSPIQHMSLQQLVIVPSTFDSVYFPVLKALSIVADLIRFGVNSFTGLAALLRATPHLTELHIGAEYFHSKFDAFSYEIADSSACPLSGLLRDLERLVFEQVGYDSTSNGQDIINLLKSDWMGIFPRNGRTGQVDLVFLSSRFPADDLPVSKSEEESGIVHEILDYLAQRGDSLGYEVHLQHPTVPRYYHAPYQISKDLAKWDEAMGFYHRCSEEVI